MESLPDEILMDFPVILRTMNRRFRDVIDPFRHWVRYNKKSRAWLALNNLRVKYLRTKKIGLAWVFPNVVEMKLYYKLHCEDESLYEQCNHNLLNLSKLEDFKKLRTVFLNYCDYDHITDIENLENINFYVKNLKKVSQHKSKNIKYLNFVNYYNEGDTKIRIFPDDTSMIDMLITHTDYKMILTFKCRQFLIEFMTDLLYDVVDGEKYRDRLFIDLSDYGYKTGKELTKWMDDEKSLIESGIITPIYPSDRDKIEDYVDSRPNSMRFIFNLISVLSSKYNL